MGNKSGKADAGGGGGGDRKSRRGGGRGGGEDAELADRKGGGGGGGDVKGMDGDRKGGDYSDSDSGDEGDGKRRDRKGGGGGGDGKSATPAGGAGGADAKKPSGMHLGALNEKEAAQAKLDAEREGGGVAVPVAFDPDAEDQKWNVDSILTTQRERKKREDETKREMQRRWERKKFPFYGEEFSSPEKRMGGWGVLKAVWYIMLLAVGMTLSGKDYGVKICVPYSLDPTLCLVQDNTPYSCVSPSDVPCKDQCNQNSAGCLVINSSFSKCLSFAEFDSQPCQDTATCSQTTIDAARDPVTIVAAIFMVCALWELAAAYAFLSHATLHPTEFAEPDMGRRFLMFMAKQQSRGAQIYLVLQIVFQIYMIYTFFGGGAREKCGKAISRSTGEVIAFNDNMLLYIIVTSFTIIGFTIIGTTCRFKHILRGELHVPMDVESLVVPADLDCASCRGLDRPRLCHDPVRSCIAPPQDDEDHWAHSVPCSTVIGCCCGCLCDSVFACTCFPIGFCLENCCKNRRWIAP